jgi:hypothetical protein
MNPEEQVSYRTATRRVEIEVEISGHLVWKYPVEDARPVLVETVLLQYDHGDLGCCVSAKVRGAYLFRGKPTKSRADDLAGFVYELWPAWLHELAETHRPERYLEHRGPISLPESAL